MTTLGIGQNQYMDKTKWFRILPATSLSADTRKLQNNISGFGMILLIKVASASSLSFTPKIEVTDIDGNIHVLWTATAALTADGTAVYFFYPGGVSGATATEKVDLALPLEWTLFLDFGTGSGTITVNACYL